jgi:DNA-binding NarL/FixJ family response regulator
MSVDEKIRIAIADDHALFRQGLKSLLALEDTVAVVAETDRLDDVCPMVERQACDILLLDLQMDRNALAEINTIAGKVPVVVVTATERAPDALSAIRSGARAVVFKRFAVESLMDAVRSAVRGEVWLPPTVQSLLASGLRQDERNPLTPREREIVRHVALGLRNAEVASKLFIGEQTVKTHLSNIFQKLGIRDRVELARYAIQVGIIGVDEGRS